MYGRILRQLRESRGLSQAAVARSVGMSPAQLARLESGQRGLYLQDFVEIVESLGDKPGNLLSNDLGRIGHLKPLIDRLVTVEAEFLAHITAIIGRVIRLTEDVAAARELVPPQSAVMAQRKSRPAPKRSRR